MLVKNLRDLTIFGCLAEKSRGPVSIGVHAGEKKNLTVQYLVHIFPLRNGK
jgi:hypothetical protein